MIHLFLNVVCEQAVIVKPRVKFDLLTTEMVKVAVSYTQWYYPLKVILWGICIYSGFSVTVSYLPNENSKWGNFYSFILNFVRGVTHKWFKLPSIGPWSAVLQN